MRPRHPFVAAFVVALTISVSGQDRQPSTETIAHLTEILSVLQKEWLHRNTMDWDTLQQRVLEKAGTAQTLPDTYDAIRYLLTSLGDKHSYYVTATGENIFNPQSPTQTTGECAPGALVIPPIPPDVGYVRIQIMPPTPPAAIQDALRSGDSKHPIG